MEVEFMTADTALPPCMPLPSESHAAAPDQQHRKGHVRPDVGYCFPVRHRGRQRDFIYPFPPSWNWRRLARSTMTVKRSLNELEDAGLILRVRQGFGNNKIYVLIRKRRTAAYE